MNEGEFFSKSREEKPVSDQEQTMRDIERTGVSSALRMMANLEALKKEGLEPSEEVLESLSLLKYKLDEYLEGKE